MTNKEAIRVLNSLDFITDEEMEAKRLAIRALEQTPDEPAPNRKEFVLVCSGCGSQLDMDTTAASVDEVICCGWRSAGRGKFYCRSCVSKLPEIEDLSTSWVRLTTRAWQEVTEE